MDSSSAAHEWFIGIDSDGCVFDTMECKHKECFIPATIKHWELQSVSRFAREAAEFVNLYSRWRGTNRWPALIRTLDLLRDHPDVVRRGTQVPAVPALRAFVERESTWSEATLCRRIEQSPDPELVQGLAWSRAVNAAIADLVHGIAPFPWAARSLGAISACADAVVVSQTPREALVREWQEHDIAGLVQAICGQEQGTKTEHLVAAMQGRYASGRSLMIGDAPGDLEAARAAGCLFFPIVPGREDQSWEQLYTEGLSRFLAQSYAGAYEDALITEFSAVLPDTPPWQKQETPC